MNTIIAEKDLEKTYTQKKCASENKIFFFCIVQIIYKETATSVSLPVSSAEYVLPLLLSWKLNYINTELFSYVILFLFTDCCSVALNMHIQYILQSLIYMFCSIHWTKTMETWAGRIALPHWKSLTASVQITWVEGDYPTEYFPLSK